MNYEKLNCTDKLQIREWFKENTFTTFNDIDIDNKYTEELLFNSISFMESDKNNRTLSFVIKNKSQPTSKCIFAQFQTNRTHQCSDEIIKAHIIPRANVLENLVCDKNNDVISFEKIYMNYNPNNIFLKSISLDNKKTQRNLPFSQVNKYVQGNMNILNKTTNIEYKLDPDDLYKFTHDPFIMNPKLRKINSVATINAICKFHDNSLFEFSDADRTETDRYYVETVLRFLCLQMDEFYRTNRLNNVFDAKIIEESLRFVNVRSYINHLISLLLKHNDNDISHFLNSHTWYQSYKIECNHFASVAIKDLSEGKNTSFLYQYIKPEEEGAKLITIILNPVTSYAKKWISTLSKSDVNNKTFQEFVSLSLIENAKFLIFNKNYWNNLSQKDKNKLICYMMIFNYNDFSYKLINETLDYFEYIGKEDVTVLHKILWQMRYTNSYPLYPSGNINLFNLGA